MNEPTGKKSLISWPGLVRGIQTALNLRGDIPQDLATWMQSVQLVDIQAPEYVVPSLGRLMTGRVRQNAVAAQFPFHHLAENSTGAQVLAVVDSITLWHGAVTATEYFIGIAPVQGVYGSSGSVAFRDGRSPTAAISTFNPTAGTAAAPAGVNGKSVIVPPNTSLEVRGPWVLMSGQNQTLEVLCNSSNLISVCSFDWKERPLLKSEAFVQ